MRPERPAASLCKPVALPTKAAWTESKDKGPLSWPGLRRGEERISVARLASVNQWVPAICEPDLLRRSRLPYRNARHAGAGITLLRGPIGYGKTTLLKQWVTEALQLGERPRYVKLTPANRTVEGLVNSLSALAYSDECRDDSENDVATLRALLTARDNRLKTLLLDDWDEILGSESERVLADILGSGELCAKLVIASRRACGIPLELLLAEHQVRMVTKEALRFSAAEERRFLSPLSHHRGSSGLLRAMDGWPLAFKLLKSLERPVSEWPTPQVFANQSGFDMLVFRQLERACTRGEKELLDILSLGGEVDVSLLNAVNQSGNSAEALECVTSMLPFEVHQNGQTISYRPAALARQVLQNWCDSMDRDRKLALCERAFSAALSQGRTFDAINYALLAGRTCDAIKVVETIGPLQLMMAHGVNAVEGVVQKIPPHLLATCGRLKLVAPIALAKRGCLSEARQMLHAITEDIRASPVGPEIKHRALVDATFVQMQISACSDRGWTEYYERTAKRELGREPFFAAWSKVCAGMIDHRRGALEMADAEFEQAQKTCEQIRADYQLLHLKIHRAHVSLARGHIRSALRSFREVRNGVSSRYPEDKGLIAAAEIGRIEACLTLSGTSVEHETIAEALADLWHADGWYEPFASAFISLARCLWRTGNLDAVLAALDEADAELDRQEYTHCNGVVEALRIYYLVLGGRISEADNLLLSYDWSEQSRESSVYWRERHLKLMAKSILFAARGDMASASALAESLVDECRRDGRQLAFIEASLNRAQILLRQGGSRLAALESLTEGMQVLGQLGAQGCLYQWQDLVERHRGDLDLDEQASGILDRAIAEGRGQIPCQLLTPREISVLQHVAADLCNKEVSRQLGIGVDAVKFHLKQCFRKLGVRDRRAAVKIARAAGLI